MEVATFHIFTKRVVTMRENTAAADWQPVHLYDVGSCGTRHGNIRSHVESEMLVCARDFTVSLVIYFIFPDENS